jgi:hypothetical protein
MDRHPAGTRLTLACPGALGGVTFDRLNSHLKEASYLLATVYREAGKHQHAQRSSEGFGGCRKRRLRRNSI